MEEQHIKSQTQRYALKASRAKEVAEGMRKHGSIYYRDMINEAMTKGKFFVDLDFPIVHKSIDRLLELGYSVKTYQDGRVTGLFHKIEWR